MTTVFFYGADKANGEFSNFYYAPITIDGLTYPTVEHFYQSSKFTDASYRELIRNAASPSDAFMMGRQRVTGSYMQRRGELARQIEFYCNKRGVRVRPDWEAVKDKVMREALRAKFAPGSLLADVLLATGKRQIVEASTRDAYWGFGADGKGKNMLGKLLMEVRDSLHSSSIQQDGNQLLSCSSKNGTKTLDGEAASGGTGCSPAGPVRRVRRVSFS